MTDLAFNDPCVVFALRREAKPFLKEFPPHQRFSTAPCWARFCGPSWLTVLVLETGVGSYAAQTAAEWLANRPALDNVPYRPRAVISAGFSGALKEDLVTGDIILATEVLDEEGKRWPATWPSEIPPPGEWRPPLRAHPVLAMSKLVSTPEEKRQLGQQSGAIAVDMESAQLARACARHQIPFGCVRVILDDLQTPLSQRMLDLVSDGQVSPLRLMGAVAKSPRMVRELWQLARRSRLAAAQLSKALGELLTLTLPWAADNE